LAYIYSLLNISIYDGIIYIYIYMTQKDMLLIYKQ